MRLPAGAGTAAAASMLAALLVAGPGPAGVADLWASPVQRNLIVAPAYADSGEQVVPAVSVSTMTQRTYICIKALDHRTAFHASPLMPLAVRIRPLWFNELHARAGTHIVN